MTESPDAAWTCALSVALRSVAASGSGAGEDETATDPAKRAAIGDLIQQLAASLGADSCALLSLRRDGAQPVILARDYPAPDVSPAEAMRLRREGAPDSGPLPSEGAVARAAAAQKAGDVLIDETLVTRVLRRNSRAADPLLLVLGLPASRLLSEAEERRLDEVVGLLRLLDLRLDPAPGDRERAVAAQAMGAALVEKMLVAPEEATSATIEDALVQLGQFLGADRIEVIVELRSERLSATHEWVAPGIKPLIAQRQDLPRGRAPGAWLELLRHGQVHVPDTQALTADDPLRFLLEDHGARSHLALTLRQGVDNMGFLGIETCTHTRRYLPAEIELARTLAAVIATLLTRLPLREEVHVARAEQEREQKRLAATLNALPDTVMELDADLRITALHAGPRVDLPVPADRLIGQTVAEAFPDQAGPLTELLRAADSGVAGQMGDRFPMMSKGRRRWYSFSAAPREADTAGTAPGHVLLMRDVTERQMNRLEIERLSKIVQSTTNMVVIADAERRVEWVNPAFEAQTGYTLADVKGRRPGDLLHGPETDPETVALMRRHLQAGEPVRCEILNVTKAGTPYWVDLNVQPIFDEGGAVTGYMSVQSNITQRREQTGRLEKALAAEAASRLRLKNAVDMMQDAFLLFDADQKLVLCNGPFKALFPEMAGRLVPGLALRTLLERGVRGGEFAGNTVDKDAWVERQIDDFVHKRRVSRMSELGGRWFRHVQAPTSDGGRILLLSDITDLRDAERRALADRGRALDASRDAMVLVAQQGTVVYVNEAALSLMTFNRVEDLLGLAWQDVFTGMAPPELYGTAEAALNTSGYWRGQVQIQLRDGSRSEIELTASRNSDSGTLYMLRDISERLKAQAERERMREELALARRREDMSLMAMSLTHDFNNLLAAISAAAGLIEESNSPDTRGLAETIGTAVEQAAGLVRRLMSLGRKQGSSAALDLRLPLSDAASLVQAGLRPPLRLVTSLPEAEVPVMGDAVALMQMAMNLCINSRDALIDAPPKEGPGRIQLILAEPTPEDAKRKFDIGALEPGRRYARVSVIDDGPGMSPETRANVFAAYYSTKGDKGTGLGVPIVAEAVRDHHGALCLESSPGKGTRFDIFLPLLDS
ncbi:PAS domain S-box protein [Pararhodobacter sp. CCB-MM2]|uniref:PAS domain S-box protein n=1 Tax=Pararhodobacter sp. CCB-MM2 TaxID=1786003 RepID=UPI00082BCB71|nr:PAS domain S-box protein [Pararhodobacter sp. CCB-MM2]